MNDVVTTNAKAEPTVQALLEQAESCLGEQPEQALILAGQAQDLAQVIGSSSATVRALVIQARAHFLNEAVDQAELLCRSSLKLARQHGFIELEASTLNCLSGIFRAHGEYAQALSAVKLALDLYRTVGAQDGLANTLCNLGNLLISAGKYAEAVDALKEAYHIFKAQGGDDRNYLRTVLNLGNVYMDMQEYAEAADYFLEALHSGERAGDLQVQAAALVNLGLVLPELGRGLEAGQHLQDALVLARQLGSLPLEMSALDSLGSWHEQAGDWPAALAAHRAALAIARRIEYADGELDALLNLGRLTGDHGSATEALELLHQALHKAEAAERRKSVRDVHQLLATVHKRQGEFEQALTHFERYHAEERELFSAERERTTRALMLQFDVERAQEGARAEREQRDLAERAQAEAEALVRERTRDLEQAQMEVVSRLAMAAEFRDDATGQHTWRVGVSAALIAEELGLSSREVEVLRVAARLHDVGKIGIPDAILLKAGKLSTIEYEEMKAHTIIGARLLSGGQSEVLSMARTIALSHHERWDGGGYPAGRSGTDIPLVGRIVAVADVFDALLQRRPYKPAWSQDDALGELRRLGGAQFDPEVLGAALRVLGSARWAAALATDDGGQRAWPTTVSARYGLPGVGPGEGPPAPQDLAQDISAMRAWYEQLLSERTAELERARRDAETYAERMRQAAFTDPLTGLGNRRAFETELDLALERAQAAATPLTVISLDLDNLKRVNDGEGGHEAGDALLRAFAGELHLRLQGRGQLYRIGGDEYAVVLPEVDRAQAQGTPALVEQVSAALHEQGFSAAGASLGTATYPDEAGSAGELLRLSDRRMYGMKRKRKRIIPFPAD